MPDDTFIQQLRRDAVARRERRRAEQLAARVAAGTALARSDTTIADPKTQALREEFAQWWSALPADARAPHYFIKDLAHLFGVSQQRMAEALRALGWRCARVWVKGHPYRHRWIPK